MKRFAAEIAACLLLVVALGLLSVWFARNRVAPAQGLDGCGQPIEVIGPAGGALLCNRDDGQIDAVVGQAGAPDCGGAVRAALSGIRGDVAQIRLVAGCRFTRVRDGFLSGNASLLLQRPLDLNQAEVEDLVELPGLGPDTAARIVEDRSKNGPFCSVEQLDRVRGVGGKTVERLGPMLRASCP